MMSREPGNATSGTHMAGALSWASISPKANNVLDVAVGYQIESYARPETQDRPIARSTIGEPTPVPEQDGTLLHGPTIELGYRLYGNRHHRVWIAGRGELLGQRVAGDTRSGMGGVVRLSGELFSASKSAHHVGVVAIGSFVELGVRELPTGKTAMVGLTGLSLRLPLAAFD